MGVLADWQILRDIKIEPFAEGASRPGVISYGVTSYGYDVRVGRHFKVFEPYCQTAAITNISAAWVAGIIDGEGHIRMDTGGQKRGLHLSVANTDLAMLEQLQELFQAGQIYKRRKQKESHKQGYEWIVTKTQHIQEILIRVLPYLTIKRQAAQQALSRAFPKAGFPMPVVDPKNFSPRALVDVEGDFCLIPPNSFALAETIEYLEIPRDILCVCLGKSTYARCFRGDTRVALVDGSAPTLEEMARRAEDGEMFWGYSIDPHGRILTTRLEQPRYIGRDALQEIILDNGESIFCTPDHLFLRRDGRMAEADQLRPGDSLMSLHRHLRRGFEMVGRRNDGSWNSPRREVNSAAASCGLRLREENGAGTVLAAVHPIWGGASSAISERAVYLGEHSQRNRKIVASHSLPGSHDVYCLTVPEVGNFALEAGVFVHNCGIIVNVTPLEPEWRGKITIEISNTTPLPAKIYAGEGIAQIVFLRGEAVCKTSYGDKRGKYQDQKGLTLPFVVGKEPAS
jgi:deoxycytidine triphosphate deaminase